MSQASAVVLATNASGTQTTTAQTIPGGVYSLAIQATTFDSTCALQVQLPNGAWASVNASAYSANGINGPYYLPGGSYRMNLGSTTSALYATLCRIPF